MELAGVDTDNRELLEEEAACAGSESDKREREVLGERLAKVNFLLDDDSSALKPLNLGAGKIDESAASTPVAESTRFVVSSACARCMSLNSGGSLGDGFDRLNSTVIKASFKNIIVMLFSSVFPQLKLI